MIDKLLPIILLVYVWMEPTAGELWQAIVKTRDVGDAGTDSDIRIIVYGTEDSTGWINLQGSFERDDTDTTTFRASIGEPYKIHLDHDGSGIASGWKLNWIKLKSYWTYKQYNFGCNCWIDEETKDLYGDTQVCRDIPHCRPGHKVCHTSPADSTCSVCEDPYYSGGWRGGCRLCPSINKCTDRHCTSSSDVRCRSCEDNNVHYKVSTDGRRCDVCPIVNKCVDQYCSTGMASTKCRRCEDNNVFYKVSPDKTRCEKLCAWNNNYCWPGTCGHGLVKNCQCASGFRLTSTSTETSCQLQRSPSIETCATRTIGPNGEMKMSKTTGPTTECQYQMDFYGNFQPVQQYFKIHASYLVDTRTFPSKATYIESYNFGITDFTVRSDVSRVGAPERILQSLPLLSDHTLSKNVVDTFEREKNLTLSGITLHSGDRKYCIEKDNTTRDQKIKHEYIGNFTSTRSEPVPDRSVLIGGQQGKGSRVVCDACTRFIQKVPGLGGYLKDLTSFHSDISQAHFSSQF